MRRVLRTFGRHDGVSRSDAFTRARTELANEYALHALAESGIPKHVLGDVGMNLAITLVDGRAAPGV